VGGVLLCDQGRNHGFKVGGFRGAEGDGVWGGGVPSPLREGRPSPESFLIFLSENGEFWCILGGASALYVI